MTDTEQRNVYTFWQKHHKGEQTDSMRLPTLARRSDALAGWEDPQPGLWKITTKGGYKDGKKQGKQFALMQVWLSKPDAEKWDDAIAFWQNGLQLRGYIDGQEVTEDVICRFWVGATFLTKKQKTFYFDNDMQFEEELPPSTGHNSQEKALPEDFDGCVIEIRGEIAEVTSFFAKNPVTSKPIADRAENSRGRLAKLGKHALELKKKEKAPLQKAVDEVEEKWKVIITEASSACMMLKDLVDTFDAAEKKRLQDEAAAKARKDFEERQEQQRKERAEQEAKAKAAREENERRLAEHRELKDEDPMLAMISQPEFVPEPEVTAVVEEKFVAPVVPVQKTLYGTGSEGNRRSTKEAQPVAVITNLKEAAIYYAEQQDPDLIKLIQKLADKAAKARAAVPGITMQKAAA